MNETALKERLKTVAKEKGIFFNEAKSAAILPLQAGSTFE
jgi:hypothetical protein